MPIMRVANSIALAIFSASARQCAVVIRDTMLVCREVVEDAHMQQQGLVGSMTQYVVHPVRHNQAIANVETQSTV